MIELYIKDRVYRKSRVEASREEIDMVNWWSMPGSWAEWMRKGSPLPFWSFDMLLLLACCCMLHGCKLTVLRCGAPDGQRGPARHPGMCPDFLGHYHNPCNSLLDFSHNSGVFSKRPAWPLVCLCQPRSSSSSSSCVVGGVAAPRCCVSHLCRALPAVLPRRPCSLLTVPVYM